jgi:hypothetical protein
LNENSRGSISGMVKPDTGQANFSENTMRSSSCVEAAFGIFLSEARRRRAVGEFGDRQPVGELQRRLEAFGEPLRDVGRTTMRSTTTSMSCLSFLSSAGASAIS